MIVNHQFRFVFYHVPKTAGSSIRNALLKLPGSIAPDGTKHLTPAELGQQMPELRDYFSFCFVRDPWERFGSYHRFLAAREPRKNYTAPADVNDFAEQMASGHRWFATNRAIMPQHNFADACSFVGRYERLEEDALKIAQRFGKTRVKLKRINSHGEPMCYRDAMNGRTKGIIAEFYQRDIEQFGYR